MSFLRSALFVARRDLSHMLWTRETMLWTFVMPILFFYFIGTVTGGMGGPTGSEDRPDILALRAPANAGFLLDELVGRLEEQHFRVDRPETDEDWARYARQLTVTLAPAAEATAAESPGAQQATPSLTDWALAGNQVALRFENSLEGPNTAFDQIRIARAVYTVLADAVVVSQEDGTPSAASFGVLAAMPRTLSLDIRPAGRREDPPVGYAQAIPGTMVMFTMLVLLTSGAISLVIERNEGLLRRLASTPISRGAVVLGKLTARLAMGIVQIGFAIGFAMAAGTVLFDHGLGPVTPHGDAGAVQLGHLQRVARHRARQHGSHRQPDGGHRHHGDDGARRAWRRLVADRGHPGLDAAAGAVSAHWMGDGCAAQVGELRLCAARGVPAPRGTARRSARARLRGCQNFPL